MSGLSECEDVSIVAAGMRRYYKRGASGRLDELCLTLAPTVVAGNRTRITAGAPVTANLVPRLLIESAGTILGRWARP